MNEEIRHEQTEKFFKTWFHDYSEGFIELRFFGTLPGQTFFPNLAELKASNYGLDYPKQYDIYFGVCPRIKEQGNREAVGVVPGLWLDVDGKDFQGGKEAALKRLNEFSRKPSLIVDSGNGYHAYWVFKEMDSRVELIEERLKSLAKFLGADTKCCDLPRILRVPGTLNRKNPDQQLTVQLIESNDNQYTLEDFEVFVPLELSVTAKPKGNSPGWVKETLDGLSEGNRNDSFTRLAGKLRSGGFTSDDIYSILEPHAGAHHFSSEELGQVVKSVSKYPRNFLPSLPSHSLGNKKWPNQLNEKAFYGIAGEFVQLIEAHTESDSAGLLIQFLIMFGSIVGDNPHFTAEADIHHCNLFGVLVGDSSKGRKGASHGQVIRPFSSIDEDWSRTKEQSGLSSGEGLIWAVRDQVIERNPIKERGGRILEYQEVVSDPGITDKRLLVYEAEFASVLRMLERDGNTLSALMRQAWDSKTLQTLTKNSRVKSTNPHISIIGNITQDELKRYMTATETANGFGNRFLWFCVKRSKKLPEGGQYSSINFAPFIKKLKQAYEFGKSTGLVSRNSEARDLWIKEYDRLSEGSLGMFGCLTARSEAQVMRIACIYALLDCSVLIKTPHLEAALEVWRYAEDSVRYLFGGSTGNPDADVIHKALKQEGDRGLARVAISKLFSGHKTFEEIENALNELLLRKKARKESKPSDGGRPSEIWVDCETSEISESSNGESASSDGSYK